MHVYVHVSVSAWGVFFVTRVSLHGHGVMTQVDRSCIIEKKMLLVLESLTTKVDSLVSRENDFKYLRSSVGQDWIK